MSTSGTTTHEANAFGARGRNVSLDVLRGLAVSLVLVRHFPNHSSAELGWPGNLVNVVYRIGWAGVDLFFVLSGFLISSLLFRELSSSGAIRLKEFWLRRGLKIWPAYFAAYGLLTLKDIVRDHSFLPVQIAWPNFVFIQNYAAEQVRWPHSWSIAIEEHFYLVLPLLLLFLVKRKGQKSPREAMPTLVPIILLLCIVILGARFIQFVQGNRDWESYYYPTHLRADGLLWGVLVGYLNFTNPAIIKPVSRAGRWVIVAALIALTMAFYWPLEEVTFSCTVGFTLLYLAFGGVVALAARHPSFSEQTPRLFRFLALFFSWMGIYSYTIYLASAIVRPILPLPTFAAWLHLSPILTAWIENLLFVAASIVGGVMLSKVVEQPVLVLRSRWFPSRSSQKGPIDSTAKSDPKMSAAIYHSHSIGVSPSTGTAPTGVSVSE